jgi:hypothetical protein
MADPSNPPGERRLPRPPSDRYRSTIEAVPPVAGPTEPAPLARSLGLGAVAGLVGAAAITMLGGALSMTAGLLVVAGATGWTVGAMLRRRAGAAIALALAAVALGQLGLWAYALWQGGVLGPLDLLWEVYGGLVPVEFLAAAFLAWIVAR